ncbi:Hpt domain-containing protein [Polaromonas sp.]|uniref:Hpt domain-containing protein n=1 Tax=Polaromonas sp. TaxID=1869339 RepID=UPI0017B54E9C|nr:Hpt domain-containing protein [Polaromonas sp.]NMM06746.1 Hpt domain-containing protein [Polaromonas sp.]
MKFVWWTSTSIARRFSSTGLGLTIKAASSPANIPLEGLPLRKPAETVARAGTAGDVPARLAETQENAAIHSRYAGNVRLSPIVRKFAGLLHEQLDLADTAQSSGDMEALARFGHWLAGVAGTVGYDAFTLPARELQALAKQGDALAAATALRQLARMASQLVVPDALATS